MKHLVTILIVLLIACIINMIDLKSRVTELELWETDSCEDALVPITAGPVRV